MRELTLNDSIKIDIKTYEWIPELKRYGPILNTLLPVTTIIELLNAGYDVNIPDKWIDGIYFLVKEYNKLCESKEIKKEIAIKPADIAQIKLEKKISNKIMIIEKEKEKNNPYIDSSVDKAIEVINKSKENPFKQLKVLSSNNVPIRKRVKLYELYAKTIVNDTDDELINTTYNKLLGKDDVSNILFDADD